jgi:LPS O-antigen subunit length determinant protein (WzzB/FepE family)
METDRMQTSDEFRLGELFALLWDSKLLIAVVTAISLTIGGVAFLLVPRTFVSKVSIAPLAQADFVGYLSLSQEGKSPLDNAGAQNERDGSLRDGSFPYTPITLLTEFSYYLRDYDRLAALVVQTGVVNRGTLSDEGYNQRIRSFISDIKFETPKAQDIAAGQHFLNFQARAQSEDKLSVFMRRALTEANAELAHHLAAEVRKRAAAIKDQSDAEAAKLQTDVDARRQRAENERNDEVTRVADQSLIAHSLGIQKPLDLRAIEMIERGNTASAQINTSGTQPPYLQGYTALDKRIEILRDRKNVDPFIWDLRDIQQQIYVAKNNPRPARILALLGQSPLAEPTTAKLARFSIASTVPEKTFPKLSVFGIGSLFLGLLLGSTIAFMRRELARRAKI